MHPAVANLHTNRRQFQFETKYNFIHSYSHLLIHKQSKPHLHDAGVQITYLWAFIVPWKTDADCCKTTQPLLEMMTIAWLWSCLFIPIWNWWRSIPPCSVPCESSGLTHSSLSSVPGGLRSCLYMCVGSSWPTNIHAFPLPSSCCLLLLVLSYSGVPIHTGLNTSTAISTRVHQVCRTASNSIPLGRLCFGRDLLLVCVVLCCCHCLCTPHRTAQSLIPAGSLKGGLTLPGREMCPVIGFGF